MTPAEDVALSAQLARALGWKHVEVVDGFACADEDGYCESIGKVCVVGEHAHPEGGKEVREEFDYRDPSVWGPVLEWLIKEHWALPAWNRPDRKYMLMLDGKNCYGTTIPEAVARAAIAVAEERRKRVEQNEAREVLQA